MQLFSYSGFVYLHGKQLHSDPIYLETRATSFRKARSNIMYRIKNWLSLPRNCIIEINDMNIVKVEDNKSTIFCDQNIVLLSSLNDLNMK